MSARVHPTVQQLADVAGVSRRTMFKAINVCRTGCEELQQEVLGGRVGLNVAQMVARYDPDSQRNIIGALRDIPMKKHLAFMELIVHACTDEAVR